MQIDSEALTIHAKNCGNVSISLELLIWKVIANYKINIVIYFNMFKLINNYNYQLFVEYQIFINNKIFKY